MTIDDLKIQVDTLKDTIYKDFQNLDLDNFKLKHLSKNSKFQSLVKSISKIDDKEKKEAGILINNLKKYIENQLDNSLKITSKEKKFDFDYSIPGIKPDIGNLHPTTETIREINAFFKHYGFSVAIGPEIETDEYNFEKLNLPKNHPARDLQDTLYIKSPEIMLRTHTSSVETRTMTNFKLPIRIVVPGKAYRNETVNKSNNAIFYQYEGLVVDKGINMGHLKMTLSQMLKHLFGQKVKYRIRPKYYPQVEPGVGADIKCPFCNGKGCSVCKNRGWIEISGAGMVHTNALKACNIDPSIYSGFAFGFGLDRLVMAKHSVTDIRDLYSGNLVYEN